MTAYPHLTLWTRPGSYAGPNWHGWYIVMGQNRDSDALTRSNFSVAARRLLELAGIAQVDDTENGSEDHVDAVQIIRDSHWAVGWVEFLYVHKDAPADVLVAADDMRRRLKEYPVLDEEHWSELEYSEAADYWASMSVRDRAELIRDSACGDSIFAARRSDLPRDDSGRLMEMLR